MLTLIVAMYVEVPMAFFGDGILIYQVIEVGAVSFHFTRFQKIFVLSYNLLLAKLRNLKPEL